MNFQISSEQIGNPILIELLKKLTDCFNKTGMPFYVIGATARDIIMRLLTDTASYRRTQDLDIAMAIPDWEKFEEVSKTLQNTGLKKSEHQHQCFYMGDYELDIVPYGGVAKDNDTAYWPPEEDIAMLLKGFDEVLQDAITVSIDGEFDIKIAPLHGLFLLKFNAWLDRHQQTDKDAEDMCFILKNYFDANVNREFSSGNYNEVYDRKDFDIFLVGGIWIAYDLVKLLNSEQCNYYGNAIQQEIDKGETSMLINQTIEHNLGLSYDLALKTWQEMANIFKQQQKDDGQE
jgi:predicted nucleotidyltransferase